MIRPILVGYHFRTKFNPVLNGKDPAGPGQQTGRWMKAPGSAGPVNVYQWTGDKGCSPWVRFRWPNGPGASDFEPAEYAVCLVAAPTDLPEKNRAPLYHLVEELLLEGRSVFAPVEGLLVMVHQPPWKEAPGYLHGTDVFDLFCGAGPEYADGTGIIMHPGELKDEVINGMANRWGGIWRECFIRERLGWALAVISGLGVRLNTLTGEFADWRPFRGEEGAMEAFFRPFHEAPLVPVDGPARIHALQIGGEGSDGDSRQLAATNYLRKGEELLFPGAGEAFKFHMEGGGPPIGWKVFIEALDRVATYRLDKVPARGSLSHQFIRTCMAGIDRLTSRSASPSEPS